MVKRHLSRLNVPSSWPIPKKGQKWIVRPSSGPHALKDCITLNLVLKELLGYAKTTKEVKVILNEKGLLVDNKRRNEMKFPAGIMDVIEIPSVNEHYRVYYNERGRFILNKITKEEAKLKPSKIIGKKILRGKKTQINFYDGSNIIVDKDVYSTGDSVVLDLSKEKRTIVKHLKFDKGAVVYIFAGKYKGSFGVVESVKKLFRNSIITVKSKDKTFETSKDYAFVIDNSFLLKDKK
jgi:small subunit ribosomal protein S4e